jgi:L-fuconolactonase
MHMNRRKFLRRASEAAVAATSILPLHVAGGESASGRGEASIPIVDTHQHLWDLSRFKLTWLRPPLDRSFTTKDYLKATQGLRVVKAVYMEVAVVPEQRLQEAEYVIGLCKEPDNPTRAAVIAGSPVDEGFEPYIMQFKGSPYVKGVRGNFSSVEQMTDKKVIGNLRLLGDLGMRFDLNVPPRFLAEGARLVDQCPDTHFVLDHCGNADPVAFLPAGRAAPRSAQHSPEQWKQDMDKLAAKGNLVCKISGLVDNVPEYPLTAEDLAPIIDHCLDAFGPDRVMFASDWPVCLRGMSLRNWVELLRDVIASRPAKDQRKLFHDNAIRFYGLGAESNEVSLSS